MYADQRTADKYMLTSGASGMHYVSRPVPDIDGDPRDSR